MSKPKDPNAPLGSQQNPIPMGPNGPIDIDVDLSTIDIEIEKAFSDFLDDDEVTEPDFKPPCLHPNPEEKLYTTFSYWYCPDCKKEVPKPKKTR